MLMDKYIRGKYTFVVKPISIDGKTLFHLSVRPPMTNEEYDDIKYRIEKLGGHWRERFGGFIFDENPIDSLKCESTWERIEHDHYDQWKIMRQFYPTPNDVAKRVNELANIKHDHYVLEPSAGKGALIDPIGRKERIVAIEIDARLASELRSAGFETVVNDSFEHAVESHVIHDQFDRIVMNPPFGPNQLDIKHIMLAYTLLKPGGILVAIMSENDLYYNTDLTKQFNEFLKIKNAIIEEVPMRSFLASGTRVDTIIVKIVK